MASNQPGVWGIDLGQCALKAIRLEKKEGEVVATAFDYIEHPKILSQPDADPDQLTREALEQFLSRNTIRGDMVVISVPGQSGLARFVKLPPVEEKKIADIVRFEAKQQIPFPLEEVVWDFQKLSSGGVSGGDYVETEIGLFAMKRDMVNRSLGQFKDVKVEVHIVQMAPLALCNYIGYDLLGKGFDGQKIKKPVTAEGEPEPEPPSHQKDCVVALDVGTDNSNLVITDGDRIIWQRPIPLGGNHFTRALTKDLKLTFAKAEHLKRNAAKSPDLKKILASLKSVLNDFVGEVQRSLGYFTNTHRDANILYMVGLGNACRLPGLQKFLQEKLQLEVRKMQKLEQASGDAVISAPTFHENILSFAVAYGLALQGLKLTRLQTNLLPSEVRIERIVRGKKPFAVAAVASLLVAIAGLAFSKSIEKAAVTNVKIKQAGDKNKSVQDGVNALIGTYGQEMGKIKDNITSLERLSSGVKERSTWQLVHQYINMALPLPNGERLTESSKRNEPVKEILWNKDAVHAYKLYEANRFTKPGHELPLQQKREQDDFIKKNLIQINIEGVNLRYSDNLYPYFDKIYKDANLLQGMFDEDKQEVVNFVQKGEKGKLPQKGWVVEVRGYTYHQNKNFIENTIIENLKYPERLKTSDGKPVPLAKQVKDMTDEEKRDWKDLKELIHGRIGYLYLYRHVVVPNPEPGRFLVIGGSVLQNLLPGSGPGAGPAAAPTPAGPAGAAAGAPSGINANWVPIGSLVKNIAGMAPPVAPVQPVGPATGQPPPRTEFVVLFIWRDDSPAVPAS